MLVVLIRCVCKLGTLQLLHLLPINSCPFDCHGLSVFHDHRGLGVLLDCCGFVFFLINMVLVFISIAMVLSFS